MGEAWCSARRLCYPNLARTEPGPKNVVPRPHSASTRNTSPPSWGGARGGLPRKPEAERSVREKSSLPHQKTAWLKTGLHFQAYSPHAGRRFSVWKAACSRSGVRGFLQSGATPLSPPFPEWGKFGVLLEGCLTRTWPGLNQAGFLQMMETYPAPGKEVVTGKPAERRPIRTAGPYRG